MNFVADRKAEPCLLRLCVGLLSHCVGLLILKKKGDVNDPDNYREIVVGTR